VVCCRGPCGPLLPEFHVVSDVEPPGGWGRAQQGRAGRVWAVLGAPPGEVAL
jgi:hypothetical protein